MSQRIRRWFEESAETQLKFVAEYADRIQKLADLLAETFRKGNKVLLFGNGGSATDASHVAAEFVGRYRRERAPLAAIALSADQAKLTCIANDYDFSEVFARQVQALGRPGDVAIGISTSGKSPNVLKGLQAARAQGLSYNQFVAGCRKANIELDRKVLADLAVSDPVAFGKIAERAKAALQA